MELIKNKSYEMGVDETRLREVFVAQYCELMGWDKNNLSLEQIHEIKNQPQYKAPSLVKS